MTESDAVVVHVQTTPDDRLAFQRNACNAGAAPRHRTGMVWGIIFFAAAVSFGPNLLADRANLDWPVAVVLSLMAGVLPFAFVQYFAARDNFNRTHDPKGMFLRRHEISASSQGVSLKSDVADLRYDWRAFVRFEETPTHFFLYADKMLAYIIPKRDFRTAEEANRFGAMLRANIKPSQPSA